MSSDRPIIMPRRAGRPGTCSKVTASAMVPKPRAMARLEPRCIGLALPSTSGEPAARSRLIQIAGIG